MMAAPSLRHAPAPTELAHAAAPEVLEAWLAAAAPGAQAIYASGQELPRDAAGVRLVSQWIEQGKVHPFRQRDPRDPARTNFLVVKAGGRSDRPSAPLLEGDAGRPTPVVLEGRGERKQAASRADMGRMLRLLRLRAARGEPCPSHRELGRMLGLKHRHAARYLLGRLVEEGRIALEPGPDGARVVRVLK